MSKATMRIDLAPLLVVIGAAITTYELWGMLGTGIGLLTLGVAYVILDAISTEGDSID